MALAAIRCLMLPPCNLVSLPSQHKQVCRHELLLRDQPSILSACSSEGWTAWQSAAHQLQ